MENKQAPTTNDQNAQSLFDVEEQLERPREEAFDKADDGEELSFDVPRD